jgi:hypothetical protein
MNGKFADHGNTATPICPEMAFEMAGLGWPWTGNGDATCSKELALVARPRPQFSAFNSGTTNFPSFRITFPSNRISPPP